MFSCDTFAVRGSAISEDDIVLIFGKNSDRHMNEEHEVLLCDGSENGRYDTQGEIRCTYRTVPERVDHNGTRKAPYRTLVCKPKWMWGAEMGANEHGLVMGNEAVFTTEPEVTDGAAAKVLTGMDLLRLAIERAKTAKQAVQTIVDLLVEYGQGGDCGFPANGHHFYYHNSYLIADSDCEFWVLETAGKEYAAKRLDPETVQVKAISNALHLTTNNDLESPGAKGKNFAGTFLRWTESFGGQGYWRQTRAECRLHTLLETSQSLRASFTAVPSSLNAVLATMRDHQPSPGASLLSPFSLSLQAQRQAATGEDGPGDAYDPRDGPLTKTICCHQTKSLPGLPIRSSQTTGALISVLLKNGRMVHYVTSSAAPCCSVFKPIFIPKEDEDFQALQKILLDYAYPPVASTSSGSKDKPLTLWQEMEEVHRAIMLDFHHRMAIYATATRDMETDYIVNSMALARSSPQLLASYTPSPMASPKRGQSNQLRSISPGPLTPRTKHARSLHDSLRSLCEESWSVSRSVSLEVLDRLYGEAIVSPPSAAYLGYIRDRCKEIGITLHEQCGKQEDENQVNPRGILKDPMTYFY
eukprot:Clim_evm19s247 gene=Clim_evmTU19s247